MLKNQRKDTYYPSPTSRARGIMSFRRTLKLRFSTPNRSAGDLPLSHAVGEELGVRAKSQRTLHTANPSDVPVSAYAVGKFAQTPPPPY
jgi:hypothetical protein